MVHSVERAKPAWGSGQQSWLEELAEGGHRRIRHRGADLSSSREALQTQDAHQACNRAASHAHALSAELPPDLAHAVDAVVLVEHAADLDHQRRVASGPRRSLGGISLTSRVCVVRRRGDRLHPADRLDPVSIPMLVDEGDQVRDRRSTSAMAKYALAFRRISLACRSSRTSRSSALMRSRSSDAGPGRGPLGPCRR